MSRPIADLLQPLALSLLAAVALATPAWAGERVALGLTPSPKQGVAPLDVALTLTFQGDLERVQLDLGDGSPPRTLYPRVQGARVVRHRFAKPGTFRITLSTQTTGGAREAFGATVVVEPAQAADPAELLSVDAPRGLAPHAATFRVGGRSLPFAPRQLTLDFGDGTRERVQPLSQVEHVYPREGRYTATLSVAGEHHTSARAQAKVRVSRDPEPFLSVQPARGYAPLEVSLSSRVGPSAAGVQHVLDGETLSGGPGRRRLTLREPGTHVFELRVRAANGVEQTLRREVVVEELKISGLYRHRGSVLSLESDSSGELVGRIEWPSPEMALQGYVVGETILRASVSTPAGWGESPGRPRARDAAYLLRTARGAALRSGETGPSSSSSRRTPPRLGPPPRDPPGSRATSTTRPGRRERGGARRVVRTIPGPTRASSDGPSGSETGCSPTRGRGWSARPTTACWGTSAASRPGSSSYGSPAPRPRSSLERAPRPRRPSTGWRTSSPRATAPGTPCARTAPCAGPTPRRASRPPAATPSCSTPASWCTSAWTSSWPVQSSEVSSSRAPSEL